MYASTLRELAIRIEAAAWRQDQNHRLALEQAWYVAALGGWKKVPKLKKFLSECFPKKRKRQTPEDVRAAVLDWAKASGLKVTRHERPVM